MTAREGAERVPPVSAPATSGTRSLPPTGASADASAMVTAEIPAVPSNASNPSYAVLMPDGSIWYPGSRRRLPAPLALRVTVWALALLVLIGCAGLVVEHFQPSWLDPLRHTVAPPGLAPAGTGNPATGTRGASSGMRLVSEDATGVVYAVPATTFTFVVDVAQRCWVQVTSPVVDVAHPLHGPMAFGRTLAAGSTVQISESAPSTLFVGASGASLRVLVGPKAVGTLPSLRVSFTYTFVPSSP